MEKLKILVDILHTYSIRVQAIKDQSGYFYLINSKANVIRIPYELIDYGVQEGLARMIMFSLEPVRASSAYWKQEDWDTLEIESEG